MGVTNLISWKSSSGSQHSIIIVEDEEKHGNEVGSTRIELCEYDSQDGKWKTKEVLDSIDEIESFGIPPGYSA